MSGPTNDEVKALVVSLLPPGADGLYSLANGDGGTGDYFKAIGQALKAEGTDIIDTLRANVSPATVTDKIPDWEAVLSLSSSPIASSGTQAQRRAQILAQLRAGGPVTRELIQSIVQPFVEYANPASILVIECPRAALTAMHTYAMASHVEGPGGGVYTQTVVVTDQENVSTAGPQLILNLTATEISELQVQVTSPDGDDFCVFNFYGKRDGAVVAEDFVIRNGPVAIYTPVGGSWVVTVTSSGTGYTINSGGIFVEGTGRAGFSNVQGLGSQQFAWVVALDSSMCGVSNPNLAAIRAALAQVTLAHTDGYVVQYMSGGGLCAVVDDPNAIASGCVCC